MSGGHNIHNKKTKFADAEEMQAASAEVEKAG